MYSGAHCWDSDMSARLEGGSQGVWVPSCEGQRCVLGRRRHPRISVHSRGVEARLTLGAQVSMTSLTKVRSRSCQRDGVLWGLQSAKRAIVCSGTGWHCPSPGGYHSPRPQRSRVCRSLSRAHLANSERWLHLRAFLQWRLRQERERESFLALRPSMVWQHQAAACQ